MSIRAGLKYCGGCNPNYDRKEIADIIGRQPGINLIPYNENEIFDIVVIICGCSSDCINRDKYRGKYEAVLINSPEQVHEVIKHICALKIQNGGNYYEDERAVYRKLEAASSGSLLQRGENRECCGPPYDKAPCQFCGHDI
jgi:hypothetical protein